MAGRHIHNTIVVTTRYCRGPTYYSTERIDQVHNVHMQLQLNVCANDYTSANRPRYYV